MNSLGGADSREEGVASKSLPVSTSSGDATHIHLSHIVNFRLKRAKGHSPSETKRR
jgi:hypothetical protein